MSAEEYPWDQPGRSFEERGAFRENPRPGELPRDSVLRLLDAAIVLVRAAGNVARVAEDVLGEQRDRLRRAADEEPEAPRPHDEPRSRIDLTY